MSSKTALVHWEEPLVPNGDIIKYELSVLEKNGELARTIQYDRRGVNKRNLDQLRNFISCVQLLNWDNILPPRFELIYEQTLWSYFQVPSTFPCDSDPFQSYGLGADRNNSNASDNPSIDDMTLVSNTVELGLSDI